MALYIVNMCNTCYICGYTTQRIHHVGTSNIFSIPEKQSLSSTFVNESIFSGSADGLIKSSNPRPLPSLQIGFEWDKKLNLLHGAITSCSPLPPPPNSLKL